MIQLERVEAMMELEKKMNLLMPQGNKEMRVLVDIAAEIRKCEVGKLLMKSPKISPDGESTFQRHATEGQAVEFTQTNQLFREWTKWTRTHSTPLQGA